MTKKQINNTVNACAYSLGVRADLLDSMLPKLKEFSDACNKLDQGKTTDTFVLNFTVERTSECKQPTEIDKGMLTKGYRLIVNGEEIFG